MPGIDIQHLMRQARKLEKAMEEARATLDTLQVEAESGGGLVKAKMDGRCTLLKLEIDAKAIDPSDKGMLEDLVTAAVNAAGDKARAAADAHLKKSTGGIQVPGLPY